MVWQGASNARARSLPLLTALIALCCIHASHGQNLRTSILAVSRYKSCLESPLSQDGGDTVPFDNQTPPNEQNFNTTGTSCEQFGNQTVTVVLVQVAPSSALGGEILTFNLKDVPGIGQSGTSGTNELACQNVPRGTQCELLQNVMTIGVESTQAFAAHAMTARATEIAYGYATLVADNQVMKSKYDNSLSYVDTYTCPTDEKWQDLYKIPYTPADGNTLLAGICPSRERYCQQANFKVACDAQFYTPTNGMTMTNKCTTLYCRKPAATSSEKNRWKAIVTKTFGPSCVVYDLDEQPSVAMNVRFRVTQPGRFEEQYLTLSTQGGRSLASIDGKLIARIVKPNLSAQIIGQPRPGGVVACFACPASDQTCARRALDDLPTTDPFVLENPWVKKNGPKFNGLGGCILPAAECRRRIGGTPVDTFWYYVDPVRMLREYTGTCNSNGFAEDAYADPTVRARVCANSGRTVGGIPTTCVPGFRPPDGDDLTNRFTYTPCQVSQIQADTLNNYIGNYQVEKIVLDYLPEGWTFNQPNCFVHAGTLYCNPLSQSNIGVVVALYIAGDFLGTVVPITHGRFVDTSCVGGAGQTGYVGFSVENTGRTTGTFFVFANFTVTSKDGQVTSDQPSKQLQIKAGETKIDQIGFRYNGAIGRSLNATLTLRIEDPSTSGLVDVDRTQIACIITLGGGRRELIGESFNRLIEIQARPCTCTEIYTCWNNLSFWGWLCRIPLALLHVVALTVLLVFGIKYCINSNRLYLATRKNPRGMPE
mgnify:CR=1 FL=1